MAIGTDRYHILQRVGRLVAIGTDQYLILQRVGGHWSPLVQIATDVLVVAGKSPNSDSKAFSESSKFSYRILVSAFPVWSWQIQISYGDVSNKRNLPQVETRTYPVVREGK